MDTLTTFCRQVRARSEDHRKSVRLLYRESIFSQIIAILRQELDSMVRVVYLLSIQDMDYRDALIKASVEGKQWTAKGNKKKITDKEMVDLANELQGWTKSVYKFGCAFIHLSGFHDYKDRDPMELISDEDKSAILEHMRGYHGGPLEENPKMVDLSPYFPMVFNKIADNLECYIKYLEEKKTLYGDDIR